MASAVKMTKIEIYQKATVGGGNLKTNYHDHLWLNLDDK